MVMSHMHEIALQRRDKTYKNVFDREKEAAPLTPFTDRRSLEQAIPEGSPDMLYSAFAKAHADNNRMSHSTASAFSLGSAKLSTYSNHQMIQRMLTALGYDSIGDIPQESFVSQAAEDIARLGSSGLYPKTSEGAWRSGRELRALQVCAMSDLYRKSEEANRVRSIEEAAITMATDAMDHEGVDKRLSSLDVFDILLRAKAMADGSTIRSLPSVTTEFPSMLLDAPVKDEAWKRKVDEDLRTVILPIFGVTEESPPSVIRT
jgi:hypothetical protein